MQPTIMPGFIFWSSTADWQSSCPGLVPGIHVLERSKAWKSGLPDFRTKFCSDKPGHDKQRFLRAHLLDQRVGNLKIGIDILHVLAFIECFNELENLFAGLVVEHDGVLRLPQH
jgi:hypothetical protein